MMMKKKKENHDNQKAKKKKRFLITVNVIGSPGPLRFIANDDDKISDVIDSSLKMYARSGRLPVLGSDFNKFLLYPTNSESDAMKANEAVGSCDERTFVMCKKQSHPQMTEPRSDMITRHHRWSRGWKAWFKISSP